MKSEIESDLEQILARGFSNVQTEFGKVKKEIENVEKEFINVDREMSSMNKTMVISLKI